jgi:hypothetical protein
MVGRGSVRTGVFRPTRGRRVNPHKRTVARCRAPEDPNGRPITEYRTINEQLVGCTTAGHFVWGHAFSRIGREAPVRTEPLPITLSVAPYLEQSFSSSSFSFSILLLGGQPQHAGGARRPVRTEPLPTTLSVAPYLEQSFSFSICSGGNRSARVARAARFGRSLSLPP